MTEFKNGNIITVVGAGSSGVRVFVGYHPRHTDEGVYYSTSSGNVHVCRLSDMKLVPEIIEKEIWVNVYPDGRVGDYTYLTSDQAYLSINGDSTVRQQKVIINVEVTQ